MSEKQPEQISFDDELRKYVLASPFTPFEIVTTSGDHYEVTDNVQVAIGTTTVGVILPRTGFQLIRKNQITAIHVHEAV
jgi:hypothetical protein